VEVGATCDPTSKTGLVVVHNPSAYCSGVGNIACGCVAAGLVAGDIGAAALRVLVGVVGDFDRVVVGDSGFHRAVRLHNIVRLGAAVADAAAAISGSCCRGTAGNTLVSDVGSSTNSSGVAGAAGLGAAASGLVAAVIRRAALGILAGVIGDASGVVVLHAGVGLAAGSNHVVGFFAGAGDGAGLRGRNTCGQAEAGNNCCSR
jgi:hypothetical protein